MNEHMEIEQNIGVNKWRVIGWSAVMIILLAPLVAMQVTDEVEWTLSDFVVAGVMLGGSGLLLELAARKSGNVAYRGGVVVAVLAALLLSWINGAVGIIGNEDNPLNLMFAVVPLVAISGSIITRFKADGLARTMVAAAIVQAIVAFIALIAGHFTLLISAFFVGLWLISARFFGRAHSAPAE